MIESLIFTVAGHHFDPPVPRDYREVNPGVLVETKHLTAGVILNSHDKLAVMALGRARLAPRAELLVGLCSGYKTPVCGAFAVKPVEWVVITYMPRIGSLNAHTLGVGLRYPL
jgi:hypothetical protein